MRFSMRFSRQEYWSELPFPSPGNLPNPGIEAGSPALAGGFFSTEAPGKPHCKCWLNGRICEYLLGLLIEDLF